jgi:hypothetical protein
MGETMCGVSMAMKVGYLLEARESSLGMIWCLWLIRSYRME